MKFAPPQSTAMEGDPNQIAYFSRPTFLKMAAIDGKNARGPFELFQVTFEEGVPKRFSNNV